MVIFADDGGVLVCSASVMLITWFIIVGGKIQIFLKYPNVLGAQIAFSCLLVQFKDPFYLQGFLLVSDFSTGLEAGASASLRE